jgi:hypothetical protein
MPPEFIVAAVTSGGALLLGVGSFLLKRLLGRIDGIDRRMTALDAITQARIHSLEQMTLARIASVEHVTDAKIRECRSNHSDREDRIVEMVVEHTQEADRKFATVREILAVQERLQAIDSNVRAVLSALDRLVGMER